MSALQLVTCHRKCFHLRSSSKKASPSHRPSIITQHPSPCVAAVVAVLGPYLSLAQGLAWRLCFGFCVSAWLLALIIKEGHTHKRTVISQHPSSCLVVAVFARGLYLIMIACAVGALSQAHGLAWRPCF